MEKLEFEITREELTTFNERYGELFLKVAQAFGMMLGERDMKGIVCAQSCLNIILQDVSERLKEMPDNDQGPKLN